MLKLLIQLLKPLDSFGIAPGRASSGVFRLYSEACTSNFLEFRIMKSGAHKVIPVPSVQMATYEVAKNLNYLLLSHSRRPLTVPAVIF